MTNDCPHNTGITCDPGKRHCVTCGGSPEGAKRRQAAMAGEKAAKVKDPKQGPTRSKRVAKVGLDGNVVEVYTSIRMAAEQNGISRDAVRNRCEGRVSVHALDLGYSFKYID